MGRCIQCPYLLNDLIPPQNPQKLVLRGFARPHWSSQHHQNMAKGEVGAVVVGIGGGLGSMYCLG